MDVQGWTAAGTRVEWLGRGSRESPSSLSLHSDDCPFAQGTQYTRFLLAHWRPVDNIDWTGLTPLSVQVYRLLLALDYCIPLSATSVAPAAFTTMHSRRSRFRR